MQQSRSTARRALPAILVLALLGTLLSVLGLRPAAAATAVFSAGAVSEAPDYATSTFGDAWDYSNSSDLLLDSGPAGGISAVDMSAGHLAYSIIGGSYISPLWNGYPGSLYLGRDGALPQNQINAATYTRVHIHAYASYSVSAAMIYFPNANFAGIGGRTFRMLPGWHDYDFAMANSYPGGATWKGTMKGFRFATNPTRPTRISVDFIRLYKPDAAARVQVRSASGAPMTLHYTETATRSVVNTATEGTITGARENDVLTVSGSQAVTVDLSAYPPGTNVYGVTGSSAGLEVVSIRPRPVPVVDSPNASGCGDWATSALGHPWRFTSMGDLAGIQNAGAISFAGGVLSATNSAPVRNDPHIELPVGRGIDGRIWHRLTLTTSYDGAFGLANAPGGGAMGRIMWHSAGQTGISQTDDLLTYSGKRTIVVDLGMPAASLTEPDSTVRYAFAGAAPVTMFRWDPNEDPGARRWHVYSFRLARDCTANATLPVTWHDNAYTAGATTRIWMTRGTQAYLVGSAAEHAGSNTIMANTRALPAGTYLVVVQTTNGTASVQTRAGSLITVGH